MKEDYFQKNSLFEDVYYLTKGYEYCVPGHHYGPARREYYLIHIIEEAVRQALKKATSPSHTVQTGSIVNYGPKSSFIGQLGLLFS